MDEPLSGDFNMAADELLLESSTVPTLRLYGWAFPCVSLGYSQAVLQSPLPVVRRPSGGRALLHDQELTYCIALPQVPPGCSIAQAFEQLTGGLGAALGRLGIEVSQATRSEPNGQRSTGQRSSCMSLHQRGELHSSRGKLVGSAQVRRGERLLQHGVIPWRVNQELLEAVFPSHPPIWGVEDLGHARFGPLDLAEALGRVWGIEWSLEPWSLSELASLPLEGDGRGCSIGLGGKVQS